MSLRSWSGLGHRFVTSRTRGAKRCTKLLCLSVMAMSLLACVLLRSPCYSAACSPSRDAIASHDDLECGCPRQRTGATDTQSLCGSAASARGAEQRVVSFSVFGDFSSPYHFTKYWSQLEPRLQDVTEKYPGWTLRLYHNVTRMDREAHHFLCTLYCKYPNFDSCNVDKIFPNQGLDLNNADASSSTLLSLQAATLPTDHSISSIGTLRRPSLVKTYASHSPTKYLNSSETKNLSKRKNLSALELVKKLLDERTKEKFDWHKSYAELLVPSMWRFLPMADPSVAEFLVRDLDSTILDREVGAVQQWLDNTTATLHVMRDHPSHNGVMLAGMWGGSRRRGSARLLDVFRKLLRQPPRQLWDYDQRLLRRVVWPEMKDSVAIHDSYLCRNKLFTAKERSLAFPSKRVNKTFVSWGVMRDHEKKGIVPCPKACRPPDHKDWTYC